MSNFLQIAGGLGVFLIGLRMMSDGLQRLAGTRLRTILSSLTRNRFAGVFSGFLITCAVQSSSATTVLIVSFANAGLLSLVQAIGLVMGANIGTTLTAWIVSLLGFKVKIAAFALPIIGIGFPLSLIDSPRTRSMSEAMVGFGLLFLGLSFLKAGVPNLKDSPEALAFLQTFTDYGFGSTLLFVAVGTILTVVVQSSSAASAITLTMVAKGWIDLDLAAAMILGENIGTTITAQLAAIGANRTAKRVAHFHTLFNTIGVLWMLPAMPLALMIIQQIIPGDPHSNILVATTQVALFHTLFNVTNTAALIGFVHPLSRLVLRLLPIREDEQGGVRFQYLEAGLFTTPELAAFEARRAVRQMLAVCSDMHSKLVEVLSHPDQKLGNLVQQIKKEEQKTDDMEEEIIDFCSKLSRHGLSLTLARDVARYLDMANDIERMGDHCMNLILLAERRWRKNFKILPEAQQELEEMLKVVGEFIRHTLQVLDTEEPTSLAEAKSLEKRVNSLRNQGRKNHAKRMQAGEVQVRPGLVFLDMMTNLEKIADYCWNVTASRHEQLGDRP